MPLIAVAVYGAILIALVVGAYAWGRWKTVLWLGASPGPLCRSALTPPGGAEYGP